MTDYNWEYGGTRDLLLPFYCHNDMELATEPANDPDGYRFVQVHGKGNCFPNVTYQLRKTCTLIGTPKDTNHPIGKRVINLDAQTSTLARIDATGMSQLYDSDQRIAFEMNLETLDHLSQSVATARGIGSRYP